jgi:hypothetical protein
MGGQQPQQQMQPQQMQVPEGLAQLAAMLAGFGGGGGAPEMSQSLAVNMPLNQKLPFQVGRQFGGDNPYITHGPGFDPTSILGRSWG